MSGDLVERLTSVVEAARAWAESPAVLWNRREECATKEDRALAAAVDALDPTAPETAPSATQSAEEGAGVVGDVGGAQDATGGTGGPPNPIADLGAEVRVSIRHRGHQWGSSKVISDQEIRQTRSPVDPVERSLLTAVDEVLAIWRTAPNA